VFVSSNPGLKSRFTKFIDFPDYDDGELVDILLRMTGAKRLVAGPEFLARSSVALAVRRRVEGAEFANGRTVRNYVQGVVEGKAGEEVVERKAERLIRDAEERAFLDECLALAKSAPDSAGRVAARIEAEADRRRANGNHAAAAEIRSLASPADAAPEIAKRLQA